MSRSCITDKGSGIQPPPKPQFRVGDKVKIIGNSNNHKQPMDKIVTLCNVASSSMISAEYSHLGKAWGIKEDGFITVRECDLELVVELKRSFSLGKWYKCASNGDGYLSLSVGKYYECKENSSTRCQIINDVGNLEQYLAQRFDINSESDYDPNSTKYIPEIEKKVVAKDVEDVKLATTQSGNNATTNVGDVNMSNVNRVVSVKFFDDDAGLKAENSLVASYEITTRANDAMTVNKLLMREDIAGDIDIHNAVRASTVDATILKNTGNKVFLQPIDFEDLRVVVSNV